MLGLDDDFPDRDDMVYLRGVGVIRRPPSAALGLLLKAAPAAGARVAALAALLFLFLPTAALSYLSCYFDP